MAAIHCNPLVGFASPFFKVCVGEWNGRLRLLLCISLIGCITWRIPSAFLVLGIMKLTSTTWNMQSALTNLPPHTYTHHHLWEVVWEVTDLSGPCHTWKVWQTHALVHLKRWPLSSIQGQTDFCKLQSHISVMCVLLLSCLWPFQKGFQRGRANIIWNQKYRFQSLPSISLCVKACRITVQGVW